MEYSTDSGGAWSVPAFPVIIENSNGDAGNNPLKVLFINPISITSAEGYFICGTDGIQFGDTSLSPQGEPALININISGVYPGLINNSGGHSSIYVYNIYVDNAVDAVLDVSGGWICQYNYGNGSSNSSVINCRSFGAIPTGGGGIVGANSTITNIYGCASLGAIGNYAGGIIGSGAASCFVEKCWSEGEIGADSGGIIGPDALQVNINKCYSLGNILTGAGGICGPVIGTISVSDCYSRGAIGPLAGGIYAQNTGANSDAVNCYSTGAISATGGGIFGPNRDINCNAIHCYTTGAAAGTDGFIYGASGDVPETTYAESAIGGYGWYAEHANTVLTDTPMTSAAGLTWSESAIGEPYELTLMGFTPYTANIIVNNSLVNIWSQEIAVGGSTITALNPDAPDNSFTIVGITGGDAGAYSTITIDLLTGVISTTTETTAGTYTVYVRSVGSYNITMFTLTLFEIPTPPADCCVMPNLPISAVLDQPTYTVINELTGGHLMIQVPQCGFTTYADYMKRRMAQSTYRKL